MISKSCDNYGSSFFAFLGERKVVGIAAKMPLGYVECYPLWVWWSIPLPNLPFPNISTFHDPAQGSSLSEVMSHLHTLSLHLQHLQTRHGEQLTPSLCVDFLVCNENIAQHESLGD